MNAPVDPLTYFWLLLKASLFSTGGTGNLPSLHADLLPRGWATERQFAESLAVGQVSPGPSGLWVISLGYLTDGLRGALLATIAINLPPLLLLVIERLYRRAEDHPAMIGFVRGLSLTVIGAFTIILINLLGATGFDPRGLLIAAGSLLLAMTGRVPVAAILALAALAGIAAFR